MSVLRYLLVAFVAFSFVACMDSEDEQLGEEEKSEVGEEKPALENILIKNLLRSGVEISVGESKEVIGSGMCASVSASDFQVLKVQLGEAAICDNGCGLSGTSNAVVNSSGDMATSMMGRLSVEENSNVGCDADAVQVGSIEATPEPVVVAEEETVAPVVESSGTEEAEGTSE